MKGITLNKFLTDNSSTMRILRTVLQGIIGVFIANLDGIITLQSWIPGDYKPLVVAVIMAILSPIMSELGKHVSTYEEAQDE